MKFTPLFAFIIILIVLIFAFFLTKVPVEPFISYNYLSNEQIGGNSNSVNVPPYSTSKTLNKVYDSIYFDTQNGNIVSLFGTPYTNTVDSTGQSLTNLLLMPRVGSLVVEYDSASSQGGFRNVVESKYLNTAMTASNTSWYYPNPTNTSSTLASSIEYQVFYFPWKNDTAIFLNNIIKKTTVGIYTYVDSNASGIAKESNYSNISSSKSSGGKVNTYLSDGDLPANIPDFSGSVKNVYAVASNVFFDTKMGTIIYTNNSSSGTSGNYNTDNSTKLDSSNRSSTLISNNSNIILGIPFSKNKTLVVVLIGDSSNPSYLTIVNVVRFDPSMPNGIDSNTGNNTDTTKNVTDNKTVVSCENNPPTTTPPASCNFGNFGNFNANDYISKTQIVPPVCPACPSVNIPTYPSPPTQPPVGEALIDVITKLKELGIVTAQQPSVSQQGVVSVTQGPTMNPNEAAGWGLANNIINQPANLANNVVGGATALGLGAEAGATVLGVGAEMLAGHVANVGGNVAGQAIGTTGNIAGQAIGTTGNIAEQAIGTGGNLAGQAIGTGGNLAGQAIGGATAMGTGAENVVGSVASNAANVLSNAIVGATTLGAGAEEAIGNVATELIRGTTSLGLGAENVIGGTVNTAGNVIGGTVSTAGGLAGQAIGTVNKTIDTAGNIVGTGVVGAENVIGSGIVGAENVAGKAISTAGGLAGTAITSSEKAISSLASASGPVNLNPPVTANLPTQPYATGGYSGAAQQIQQAPPQIIQAPPQIIQAPPQYIQGPTPGTDFGTEYEEYEYVYEEIPEEPKPTPQIIMIQAPTPSLALMPTMPPLPEEEIYECEDDYEDDYYERPSDWERKRDREREREKDRNRDQNKTESLKDSEIYKYYYNIPPGPGANGYYGNMVNKETSNFMPMSSDLSKFGR